MAISLSSPTTPGHHSFPTPSSMPRRWMRDFYRRPLIVKQLAVLSLVFAVVVPYLLFAYWSGGGHDEQKTPARVNDAHPYWDSASRWDVQPVPPPVSRTHGVQTGAPTASVAPHEEVVHKPSVAEPITFALIMWSEDSASEGAILVKVRRSPSFLCLTGAHKFVSLSSCTRPRLSTSTSSQTNPHRRTSKSASRLSSIRDDMRGSRSTDRRCRACSTALSVRARSVPCTPPVSVRCPSVLLGLSPNHSQQPAS